MTKPKKKTIIWIAILIVIIVTLFPSLVYRILPSSKVSVGEAFELHKGQTMKFGNDKYLTMCGFRNIELSRAGSIVSWKIGGKRYPCEWTTEQFSIFDAPHNPYSLEEVSGHSSGPLIVKIIPSDDRFNAWSLEYLKSNCDTSANLSNREEGEAYRLACYKEAPSQIGNPEVCRMQNFISEKECLDSYIEGIRKYCVPRKEEYNIGAGTWTSGVDNQDDCLKEKIIFSHLPSENCTLLIEDKLKSQSCFDERKKEEDYFNLMRAK